MQDRPAEPRGMTTPASEYAATHGDAERNDHVGLGGAEAHAGSPGVGADTSSASPFAQDSSTSVGDEPATFQRWDTHQGSPGQTWSAPELDPARMVPAAVGVAGAVAVGGLMVTWLRRRRARRPVSRLRAMFLQAGAEAARYLPKAVGKAASRTESPLVPFALLPVALLLRAQGGRAEKASRELLKPLKLESRSRRLARDMAKVLETEGRQLIRANDPTRERGRSWTPWLAGLAGLGGAAYLGYRRWMSAGGAGVAGW